MMIYRELGATGEKVSALTLGGWLFGGGGWGSETIDDDVSVATIHAAIDAGITMVDTAELYGSGHSEKVVGRALKGRRADMMVATKVWEDHMTAAGVRGALEASLTRLAMDYVDLYQIHRPADDNANAEVFTEMVKLQEEGKTRWLGLSNFDARRMELLSEIGRFETNQSPYNLYWRFLENEVQPWCAAHKVSLIPYSPLAQGMLSGKVRANHDFSDDWRRNNYLFMGKTFEASVQGVEKIRAMGATCGYLVPLIALAWLLEREAVTSPIVGARTPDQIVETAKATDVRLTEQQTELLDEISKAVMESLGDVPMMYQFKREDVEE